MALITFSVSGQTFDTSMTLAQRGPTYPPPPPTPPTVDLEDALTAGTLGAQVQGSNQNYIIWKDMGKESTRDRWPMDTEAAVELGLNNIILAHDAGVSITLHPDGTDSPVS